MAAKLILLSMEASKGLALEKAGNILMIFLDGGVKDLRSDQVISTTVDGEKLR